MTSFCDVPAGFQTCKTTFQRLSTWVHVEPNFLAFECIRLLLNVFKWLLEWLPKILRALFVFGNNLHRVMLPVLRMFGILERWNNNQVTPSLSKPHELSYRSNIFRFVTIQSNLKNIYFFHWNPSNNFWEKSLFWFFFSPSYLAQKWNFAIET